MVKAPPFYYCFTSESWVGCFIIQKIREIGGVKKKGNEAVRVGYKHMEECGGGKEYNLFKHIDGVGCGKPMPSLFLIRG